jgi:hypothetical protein
MGPPTTTSMPILWPMIADRPAKSTRKADPTDGQNLKEEAK